MPMSLPSEGAWIEMRESPCLVLLSRSLPSEGAWIEIASSLRCRGGAVGRSPQRERGLKFVLRWNPTPWPTSLPSGGAWIEMVNHLLHKAHRVVAPLRGSVD